jgi:ribonuclease BN (tRNA processing enzyme)
LLGIRFDQISGIILSHGHFDHFTGLPNVLKRISSERSSTVDSELGTPVCSGIMFENFFDVFKTLSMILRSISASPILPKKLTSDSTDLRIEERSLESSEMDTADA